VHELRRDVKNAYLYQLVEGRFEAEVTNLADFFRVYALNLERDELVGIRLFVPIETKPCAYDGSILKMRSAIRLSVVTCLMLAC